jgi:hypothetical protein
LNNESTRSPLSDAWLKLEGSQDLEARNHYTAIFSRLLYQTVIRKICRKQQHKSTLTTYIHFDSSNQAKIEQVCTLTFLADIHLEKLGEKWQSGTQTVTFDAYLRTCLDRLIIASQGETASRRKTASRRLGEYLVSAFTESSNSQDPLAPWYHPKDWPPPVNPFQDSLESLAKQFPRFINAFAPITAKGCHDLVDYTFSKVRNSQLRRNFTSLLALQGTFLQKHENIFSCPTNSDGAPREGLATAVDADFAESVDAADILRWFQRNLNKAQLNLLIRIIAELKKDQSTQGDVSKMKTFERIAPSLGLKAGTLYQRYTRRLIPKLLEAAQHFGLHDHERILIFDALEKEATNHA